MPPVEPVRPSARGVTADVGTADGREGLVRAAPRCDILVNNAGVSVPGDFLEIPDTEWEPHWEVKVMAGVRLARSKTADVAVARELTKRMAEPV